MEQLLYEEREWLDKNTQSLAAADGTARCSVSTETLVTFSLGYVTADNDSLLN